MDAKTTKWWSGGSELRRELLLLAKLAGPLVISSASDYLGKVLTTIFAGRFLSTDEFDGVALGNTMTNITGYSMIIALASPMDSLCTQANGARNWKLYSLTVHRALICTALFLIPVIILWLNMNKLLVLCGQDPVIAAYVYQWTLCYLGILPAYTIRTVSARFLSSQGIAKPLLWIGIVVYLIWHPFLLYFVFVVLSKREFIWAPLCNVITAYLQVALILGYIVVRKPHHPLTFQRMSLSKIFRWSTNWRDDTFIVAHVNDEHTNLQVVDKGISEYVQLVFAGIFSLCAEWWSWEIITILSGLLGPIQLAVHVIYATLMPLYYMITLGVGLAGASRVGTLIGENRFHLAKRLGDAILWFTLAETLVLCVISYCFRSHIPRLFTRNEEVIDIAAKLSPLFCLFVIPDGLQGSFQGVLRGIKRQGKSAIGVLVGPWLISIPLACILAFDPSINWQIFGMWTGNNTGYFVMDFIFLYFWITFEWDHADHSADSNELELLQHSEGDTIESADVIDDYSMELLRASGSIKCSHFSPFAHYAYRIKQWT